MKSKENQKTRSRIPDVFLYGLLVLLGLFFCLNSGFRLPPE
jgi:hypothetical protein